MPFSFSFFLPPLSLARGGEQETSHAGERVAYPVSRAILNANFIKDFSSQAVGFLLNFYSYRFKARSEIYRANICLIFKMHRVSKAFYNHRF